MTDPHPTPDAAHAWRRKARRTACRVNFGWWLHALLPIALGLSLVAAVALLIARANRVDLVLIGPWLAAAAVCACVAAAWRARRRFYRVADALVRIEAENRMHNRLTAAAEGVGAWPPFDPRAGDRLTWRWRALLVPLAVSALCLAGAWWTPIGREAEASAVAVQPPSSWTQIEDWVNTLREDQAVREESLRQIEDQLAALRQRPPSEWYQHNSLEAGDHLKDQVQVALEQLDRDLAIASAIASRLSLSVESGQGLDPATLQQFQKKWGEAMKGLEGNILALDPSLLSSLKNMDLTKLKNLSVQELKDIQDKLSKCGQCAGQCLGKDGAAALAAGLEPGAGGIGRGPGRAPLTLSDQETKARLKNLDGVSNTDLRQAAIGDVLAEQQIEHNPDRAETASAGGALAGAGGAGEAVWRVETTPDEQAVLQRYFRE